MTEDGSPPGLDTLDLRRERDGLRRELDRLETGLDEIRSESDAVSELLRTLNMDRAVAKREIHILQNEIYRFKRKREEIDQRLRLDLPDFHAKRETLAQLQFQKKILDDGIRDLGDRVVRLSAKLGESEDDIRQGREQLARLEETKRAVTEEISGHLKKASLDREKIDEELNSVAEVFRDSVSVRDETAGLFNETKAELGGLREECARLEDRIRHAEEAKLLSAELAALRSAEEERSLAASAALDSLSKAQGELDAKRGILSGLAGELDDMNAAVAALESEVGPYEEARLAGEQAGVELADSRAAVDRFEARLLELFEQRVELTEDLRTRAARVAWIADLELA
jgi:chromosome segregation ATPase